ncbi:DUF3593 domain-containing protein [Rhodoferax sp. 4810]|uniref:DUF3593 domain-containing protein n=1 Tax=Thiospirillum jenense TaxID=1653858 RepID=A0A839HC05_9GAMM|nr:DUF2499 domain-containing protein [Thiospirillum jenense]MBB1073348.1 DUF3593 domain-containing protein [Rhodoferax jenense]MBB1125700.1 DUF3593 domain-containing protein [Thiospirillum jenense]
MLLSFPTWCIHLLTVTEWLVAIRLFYQYGLKIQQPALCQLAYSMVPHLIAGGLILLFHASGDQWTLVLNVARVLTFCGSLLLLTATLALSVALRGQSNVLIWRSVPLLGFVWLLILIMPTGLTDLGTTLLPSTNVFYLCFLFMLLVVYRQDRRVFSPVTIVGFWLLLGFVAATITAMSIVKQAGLPSLSHADHLHGLSESVLSLSNLLIAVGVYRRLQQSSFVE